MHWVFETILHIVSNYSVPVASSILYNMTDDTISLYEDTLLKWE